MSFHYTLTKKKKKRLQPGTLSAWGLCVLPPPDPWGRQVPLASQNRAREGTCHVCLTEWVWVRVSCPGRVPASHPELLGPALAAHDPELKQVGWKIITLLA